MAEGTPLLSTLDSRIEAALFAARRPVKESEIAKLLPAGTDVAAALLRIQQFWNDRGIRIAPLPAGWIVEADTAALPDDTPLSVRKLSEAAIATLAVIAMHQPVTVAQIEKVRGVKVLRAILDSLEASGLIAQAARRVRTGLPIAYVVTPKFLERFDLSSLSDLPTSEEALMLDLDLEPVTGSAR